MFRKTKGDCGHRSQSSQQSSLYPEKCPGCGVALSQERDLGDRQQFGYACGAWGVVLKGDQQEPREPAAVWRRACPEAMSRLAALDVRPKAELSAIPEWPAVLGVAPGASAAAVQAAFERQASIAFKKDGFQIGKHYERVMAAKRAADAALFNPDGTERRPPQVISPGVRRGRGGSR